MGVWQTIETAPKDGDPIMVSDGEMVECAAWVNGRWVASTGMTTVWEGDGERGGLMDSNIEPTHWMSLPEPPHA